MDWSPVIFFAIILFFAYRGYRRGLLRSLSRILGVVAGYACAIVYTGQVSQLIEASSQLQGIVAFIVAGLSLFVGASLTVALLFWLLEKLLGGNAEVSMGSAAGGAVVGLATGLLVALVVVWTISFVRDTRPDTAIAATAPAKSSRIEAMANEVAGKAVSSAMSLGSANPEITRMTAALAESPGEIVQQAQRLAQSEDMTALLHDPRNQAVLNSGDIDALRRLPAFQNLMRNPDLQALAESTGLLDEAAKNNQDADAVLAQQFTKIWSRTQKVKTDPRVQEILSDPEFRQKIQSGNPLDLLGNEQLLELANIIFSEQSMPADAVRSGTDSSTFDQSQPQEQTGAKPESNKQIYTWTDEKGQLHVSDVPPDN